MASGHGVDEVGEPVEEQPDLAPAGDDLGEDGVDLLDLAVVCVEVGLEHELVLVAGEPGQLLRGLAIACSRLSASTVVASARLTSRASRSARPAASVAAAGRGRR